MATRLRRVRIQGFRRIQEPLDLALEQPSGGAVDQFVLAGPNGCGKTSVLEAVLFALGREDLILRDLPVNERGSHWRGKFPAGALLDFELVVDQGAHKVRREGSNFSKPPSALYSHRLPDDIPPPAVEYFSSWRAPVLVGAVRPLAKGNRPRDTESNRLWRLKQRIIDEWMKALASGRPARHLDWLTRLNSAWAVFHGDDGTTLEPQLEDPDAEDALADLFLMRGERRICSVDQVSSGEIELLTMAGALVMNDLQEGIILIDEPELHLHPQWQGVVLRALRQFAPKAQFIVASHADGPWDAASSWERVLLVPEDDPRSKEWRSSHPLPHHD